MPRRDAPRTPGPLDGIETAKQAEHPSTRRRARRRRRMRRKGGGLRTPPGPRARPPPQPARRLSPPAASARRARAPRLPGDGAILKRCASVTAGRGAPGTAMAAPGLPARPPWARYLGCSRSSGRTRGCRSPRWTPGPWRGGARRRRRRRHPW